MSKLLLLFLLGTIVVALTASAQEVTLVDLLNDFISESDSLFPVKCTNVASALRVRSSPNGRVVKYLKNNFPVNVLGVVRDNTGASWTKIGTNQYVSSSFLKSCNGGATNQRRTRPTQSTRRSTQPTRKTKPTQSTRRTPTPQQTTQRTGAQKRCTNVVSALNVRNRPNGNVVRVLGRETPVSVFDYVKDSNGAQWARIGTNQFVSAQFLKATCGKSTPSRKPIVNRPVNKPVVNKPVTKPVTTPTSTPTKTGNKAEEALSMIFKSEGKCQNWASDSGNKFQGKIGYTCMGVTPVECWNNRNGVFSQLVSGFSGHPADFCYYAYNRNQAMYKQAAAQLYERNYFASCKALPQPAYYVCADISVNSGTGRARQYINELGGYNGQDAKTFARQLNEKHRQDYIKWGCPTCKNRTFLKGWLARADERARYINNY